MHEIISIKSADNPIIKELLETKKDSSYYFAEGVRIAEEFLKSGKTAETTIVSGENLEDRALAGLFDKLKTRSANSYVMTSRLFRKFSDVEEPQGIAFFGKRGQAGELSAMDLSDQNAVYVLLDGISDPGNIGTIIRTCKAAGVKALFTSKGSVSAYNPKVLRSTMGTVFSTAIIESVDPVELIEQFKKNNIKAVGTSLEAKTAVWDSDISLPVILIFGNEARGISKKALELTDLNVKLPITGDIYSLNVAVSTGIMIYEMMRRFKLY